jgi:2-oxoglutarate/2-oxoacid ferredoxin oxidoreductase subunit alpha
MPSPEDVPVTLNGRSPARQPIPEHVVEIVSDAGEGAQKAGQSFGTISAKMGNGIWTVEIIPAEIQPPPRNAAGASGIRVRVGSFPVTNMGDQIDLIVAFNEQALLGRMEAAHFTPGARILLESKWRTHADPEIAAAYQKAYSEITAAGYDVIEIPMEEICLRHVSNPQRGKNMLVLGILCFIYGRDLEIARKTVAFTFRKKAQKVVDSNLKLLDAGFAWATENLDFCFSIASMDDHEPKIVVNGNQAIALGVMASGMEVCAMYPITPATSASHYLSDVFENVGGVVHQAEDEIAAAGVAIGASFAGKCAVTITSGPGMSLKTELIGLASMAEIPLVIVNVQRGGPSTGLPTKVEQGDLLQAMFGAHGDAPKVVMAPSTIEDCFYSITTARKIAETFRMPVVVLSDANLATGQQPFTRPEFQKEWVAPPIDQRPVPDGAPPYDWDNRTGLSARLIPGQKGGMFTLTGLAHTRSAKVAYGAGANQEGCDLRSLKLAALSKTLSPPKVFGEESGDLLVLGWGSTRGAIEEAVSRSRERGLKVSALHLTFLQPLAPGIGEILKRFDRVVTVEINYADDPARELITPDNRRFSNLAWILRARYLVDIQSFARVPGRPLRPIEIEEMIQTEIQQIATTA